MTQSASIIELIKTVTSEGDGTPENPFKLVTRYWTKEGNLLFKEGTQENNHITVNVNVNSPDVDLDSVVKALKKHELLQG